MANEIKLPEETLMKLGFKTLDLMYGELTIKKGNVWDEIFFDKDGDIRLVYDKPRLEKESCLCYLYDDRNFFFSIIPVADVDYLRVLRAWFEERYKREVDTTSVTMLI